MEASQTAITSVFQHYLLCQINWSTQNYRDTMIKTGSDNCSFTPTAKILFIYFWEDKCGPERLGKSRLSDPKNNYHQDALLATATGTTGAIPHLSSLRKVIKPANSSFFELLLQNYLPCSNTPECTVKLGGEGGGGRGEEKVKCTCTVAQLNISRSAKG